MEDPSGVVVSCPKPCVECNPVIIPITLDLVASRNLCEYVYRIGPSDILQVVVWQHPEFTFEAPCTFGNPLGNNSTQGAAGSTGYLVNAQGQIYFPLVGYIDVAGKSVDDIRSSLTCYLKQYVVNPQINVRVADFRSQKVYVLGAVTKPGFLPLSDQALTLAGALTFSGSIDSSTADPTHIYVIRGNPRQPQIYWLDARTPDKLLVAEKFYLQPSDIVYVSTSLVTRWNHVISQILPTLSAVYFTKSLAH